MKYGVCDSEDEFPEENSDQEREIYSESEGGTEDDESIASGSVVIAPVDQEVLQRQQQEELKTLSENPYFKTLVKEIVDANVAAALSEAKKINEKEKTQSKGGKFVKRIISNPKSPSDTTIYTPALNLTPEKVTGMTRNNVVNQIRPNEIPNQVTQFLNTM